MRRRRHALPAGNWHRIHPAIGLRVFDEDLAPIMETDLGDAWLALPEDERDDRETQFYRDLLRLIANKGNAHFVADPTLAIDDAFIRAAAGLDARSDLRGPLSAQVASVLPERNVEALTVTLADELVLVLHDGWTGVVISIGGAMDRADVETLLGKTSVTGSSAQPF